VANRHFGKVADVWKHLPLTEILAIERPAAYWESHAGSAVYEWVDDPERRYGAARLPSAVVGVGDSPLATSRYLAHLRSMGGGDGTLTAYWGSPRLAMAELGSDSSYLLCDLDKGSVADLAATADHFGLGDDVEVVAADGMAALNAALATVSRPSGVLAHVDPYDPRVPGPSGLSALDLARRLVEAGAGLVYWYGYDRPERRMWALDELAEGTTRPLWVGDMLVTGADGATAADGDLGVATTPGTGFGIVCANLSPRSLAACEALGVETSASYDGVPLPDGTPGRLDFDARAIAAR
jgi:23S rRNA A2030 N6-methylase RlmJ